MTTSTLWGRRGIACLYWANLEVATPVLDHLPDPFRWLLPELDRPDTVEPRATCDRCPLAHDHGAVRPERPWAFHPEARCCTFNPPMPNFLVGSALARGGDSERVIRARLEDPVGVRASGVFAPPEYTERYAREGALLFGHDVAIRCPYWVGGDHACGVWKDRAHTCRSWHCRHDHGAASRTWWRGASKALAAVESALAQRCVADGEAPSEGAALDAWVAWYRWCADHVAELTRDQVETLRTPKVEAARGRVHGGPPASSPLPDVVVSCVGGFERDDDTTWIVGYSIYDVLKLDPSVFVFLARLDGTTPWREALAGASSDLGRPVSEELVRELFRIGAIRAPEPGDVRGDGAPGYHDLAEQFSMRIETE